MEDRDKRKSGAPKKRQKHKEVDLEEYKARPEELLKESEERLRLITDNLPVLISYVDSGQKYRFCNKAYEKWFGCPSTQITGKHVKEILGEQAYKVIHKHIEAALSGQEVTFEALVPYKDGGERYIRATYVPHLTKEREVKGFFVLVDDVTEHKKVEEEVQKLNAKLERRVIERTAECETANKELQAGIAERMKTEDMLQREREGLQIILDSVPAWIFYKDKENRFIRVNKAYADATGLSKENLEGKSLFDLYSKEQAEAYWRDDKEVIASGKPKFSIIEPVETKKGRLWVQTDKIPYRDAQGNIIGIIGFAVDITEREKAEQELEVLNKELLKTNKRLKQLALRDPETGLYNHRYLGDIIESEFYRARRYGHPLSVIMIDVDYFNSINDVYGHDFGDLVLRQLSNQLKGMVRKYDILIRFAGEEFVIISPGIEIDSATALAQRISEAINLYNFGNKKHTVKLKLSVAVSSYPEDRITRGMDLIELTDHIMNRIKEEGGDKVYSTADLKTKRATAFLKEEKDDVKFFKEKIEKLTKRGNQNLIEAISAFAKTIELKDHYTGEHGEKTVHYATEIAKILGLPREEIEFVKQAAILHDLGKIGISEKILMKKSKLTKKEFDEIKKHPQIGADILRPIQFMHDIIPLMLYHHERWDGKGYPAGLKGEEIPVGARIIAIADVYQALTSDRPYRKAYPKKEAVKIIKKGSGTQFDPNVVTAFLNVLRRENNHCKPRKAKI